MTVFGWCIPHRSDMPSTPTQSCADCGHVLIPPSWSDRRAAYPWPERPAGWSWTQPVDPPAKGSPSLDAHRQPAPKKAKPFEPSVKRQRIVEKLAAEPSTVEIVCEHCRETKRVPSQGGTTRRFCSPQCRCRARDVVRRERERQARYEPKPCRQCGTAFRPEQTSRQMYCSHRCSIAFHNAVKRDRQREARKGVAA